jgi:hypothetical protein
MVSEVQSLVGLLHCRGPVVRQNIMVVEQTCSPHGSQEAEREEPRTRYCPKDKPSVMWFLQLSPTAEFPSPPNDTIEL